MGNYNRKEVNTSGSAGDALITVIRRRSPPGTRYGPLNPTWLEWLMGFPAGWTDVEPSATPSSPKSPNTSAG
jgi:hypothetical protein